MAYKEVESGNVWKPEKDGDFVEGVLKAARKSDMFEGNFVYDLETKNGLVSIFGTAVLNSRMQQTKVGDKLKIQYVGTDLPKIKGHNPTKLFKVFKDE